MLLPLILAAAVNSPGFIMSKQPVPCSPMSDGVAVMLQCKLNPDGTTRDCVADATPDNAAAEARVLKMSEHFKFTPKDGGATTADEVVQVPFRFACMAGKAAPKPAAPPAQ